MKYVLGLTVSLRRSFAARGQAGKRLARLAQPSLAPGCVAQQIEEAALLRGISIGEGS